jgi:restriction endonuclease S subunit
VSASGAYAGYVAYHAGPIFASDCTTIEPKDERVLAKFLYYALKARQNEIYQLQVGMGQPHVYAKDLGRIATPVPPIAIQNYLVSQIERDEVVMRAAESVVQHYRPHIEVDPRWPT